MTRFAGFIRRELGPHDGGEEKSIVDATERNFNPLNLRPGDVFIATAWWTAQMANQATRAQQLFFKRSRDLVYLIQDDEPNFYGWGSKWVLAENTYKDAARTIAIVNSEELAGHFERQQFESKGCYASIPDEPVCRGVD